MVFYRKYRPQKFSDLLGQEQLVQTILGQLESGKISHGYLFHGPRGTGKTSTARILAKALNCEVYRLQSTDYSNSKRSRPKTVDGSQTFGEPCGRCNSCKSITEGSYLDLIEIDAASNRGIDEIRELREKVKLSPVIGKFKVYIIDEVHMLTTEAFNALLKTLEEPPSHVIFILCTTEQHKLPQTIISRLSRFSFQRARGADIVKALKKIAKAEKLELDDDVLVTIARASDGSYRDALSLLDQAAGSGPKITTEKVESLAKVSGENLVFKFSDLLIGKQLKELVKLTDGLADNVDLQSFNRQLIFTFEEALKTKIGVSEDPSERILRITAQATFDQLANILKHLLVLEGEMKIYPLPETALLLMLCKWCGFPEEKIETAQEATVPEVSKVPQATVNPEESETKIKVDVKEKTQTPEQPKKSKQTTVTLSQIETQWPQFLGKIRPINAHLVALLRATRPTEIEGDTLYLEVFFRFHKDKLEEPKIMNLLCDKLKETVGDDLKIRLKLAQRTTRPTKAVEKSDVVDIGGEELSKIAEEIFLK